ncbi:GspH/FimT family pseudopilin [Noviherbaspirillum massiliense]|uniref:GspH/FimT family pseudopilin n=1 Tax=Noviherbaspirillum massiliense TaxID=1465823 RepID=UPI0002E6B82A|nr:GspH/FimT family pseudopilin [Noviherbaspirillum massiliense]
MLSRLPSQRGVTLIELMIGLVIMAIVLGFGVPSFSNFIQSSHIRNAAEAVQNGLSLARSEAVRRNTQVKFVLGTGSSWSVGCVTADPDNCPDPITSRDAAEGSSKASVTTSEVVASTNAAVASPAFTDTLVFNGLGRERTLPPANNAVFDITNPDGGTCVAAGGKMRCLRVVVTPGGQIRMCDPAIPAATPPNPQAC